ncbi:hypothetical protein V8B97DRAFT_1915589 [Scleroderma yunnanense]
MDIQSIAADTYPGDHILLKCLPFIPSAFHQSLTSTYLRILESAHCGFMISFNNSYLIDGFGDLLTPQIIAWDFVVDLDIGFVLILAVNSFFIWRVWKCLARQPSGIYRDFSLCFHVDVTWKSFKDHAYAPLAVSMGVATLGDTLITLTLAYHLHSKRTQSSTQLVTRLLAYVVGTEPSMFSIVKLISVKSRSELLGSFYKIGSPFIVYANSILLSLNLRQYQRRQDVVLSLGVPNITLDDRTTLIC